MSEYDPSCCCVNCLPPAEVQAQITALRERAENAERKAAHFQSAILLQQLPTCKVCHGRPDLRNLIVRDDEPLPITRLNCGACGRTGREGGQNIAPSEPREPARRDDGVGEQDVISEAELADWESEHEERFGRCLTCVISYGDGELEPWPCREVRLIRALRAARQS